MSVRFLDLDEPVRMRMSFGPEDEAFRAELERVPRRAHPARSAGRRRLHGRVLGRRDSSRSGCAHWQATLFDHGWMIPGYPPELGGRNCTPVQTLIYLETLARPPHPALGALPRLRDRRAEPARVRQRRAAGARAGRDPRRHDLVHRHERAERGLRPRRPADARRGVRRPLRRERPEGVDVVRDDRAEVLLLRAHRPDGRRSTRASRC